MQTFTDLYNRYFKKGLDLSKLPPDIQQQILSQDPELIRKGRKLNTNMRSRLSSAYLDKICNAPINNNELVNNRFTISIWFATYRIEEREMSGHETRDISFIDYAIDMRKDKGHNISFNKYLKSNVYEFKIKFKSGIQSRFHKQMSYGQDLGPYVDVITIWLIYSKRRDCVNLDPDYPRKQTIATFQQFVQKYKTRKIGDLLFLFSYLIAHIWLFKAEYRALTKFYIAVDNNDEALPNQDIIYDLAPKINKYTPFDDKTVIPDVYNYLLPKIDEISTFVINILNVIEFDYSNESYSYNIDTQS